MPPKPTLIDRANAYQRQSLPGVRALVKLALVGRDRTAPAMAETRELVIPGPGGPLEARFYRPSGAIDPGPILVFFHGGGFVFGDVDEHDAFHRRLADAAGISLIGASYRLAPEAPFPAQLDDALAVARWTMAHASALGLDPHRLALGGDSAGGYLAVAATAELNAEARGTIAAQVLVYPLLQLDEDVWASSVFRDSRVVGRLAVNYIRAQLSDVAATIPSLTGLGGAGTPPTLIATGGMLDPTRPDAAPYADGIRRAGGVVVVREYLTLLHGFGSLTHASGAARAAVADIGRLAGEMLRDGATSPLPA